MIYFKAVQTITQHEKAILRISQRIKKKIETYIRKNKKNP